MQNEEFVELVKSSISENGLNKIPGDDLIKIYKQAISIEASSNIPDDELSKVINTLMEEINKRGLSPDSKQQDNNFKTIHSNEDSSFKQNEAIRMSKWIYIIAIPIIVISVILIINKSFYSEVQKAPTFDILGYRDKYKGYYGDMPLEDVAKDVFQRDYKDQYPDYETWKKDKGIEPLIQEDNDRRKPSLSDKFKEFKIPFPFRFDEESIDGYLFRFDRLTQTVEFRRSLGNNKYQWEPKPYYRNLQHVRDHRARIYRDRQIRAIENQTSAIEEQREAMDETNKMRHNSDDDYRQHKERQLQDNVEDIKNILEAERRDWRFREMNR
jgi:hypothetical protein